MGPLPSLSLLQSKLKQEEMIIELPFAAPDTAETLAQLGLRVENMTLAQNDYDSHRKV
jgi:hypothetical protein